jgi:hypothetical protein
LTAPKSWRSARKIVVFTTDANDAPAAASTAPRFSRTRSHWTRTSPAPTISPVFGSSGICPEQNTRLPPEATTACAYGPIAFGALSVEIFFRIRTNLRPFEVAIRDARSVS